MKAADHDQKIIDQLKKLPKIVDRKNKDELFQRISSQLHIKKTSTNKRSKFIPIFSTLLVIAIIFIIVPPLMNQNISLIDKDTGEEKASFNSTDSDNEMEMAEDDAGSSIKMDEPIKSKVDVAFPSYVIQEVYDDSTIIYGAVSDDQVQSVIPLAIAVPKTNDLNAYYNQIDDYLSESEWGTSDYLFDGVIFNIDLSNHQVTMELPKDFSVGEGSAGPNMFSEVLTTMFRPYQIEKVVFNTEVDLGPIGVVTEFSLHEIGKVNYKLYKSSDYQREFLIPIKQETETIEEAIIDMKNNQASFNIYPTIPDDVEFSLTSSDKQLHITFKNARVFEDEQAAIMMIEAILMTAKSFNYDAVKFIGAPIDVVGPYQLSEPIPVPEAVNPVYVGE